MKARIEKGQLDGTLSGGMMCNEVMPSMKVLRVPGVFLQDRGETRLRREPAHTAIREGG